MPFDFTADQWAAITEAIGRAGGQVTDDIRAQLRADVSVIFNREADEASIIDALKRVSSSARSLDKALRDLAKACLDQELRQQEPSAAVIENDVKARMRFARQVRAWAQGADWTLDKGYSVYCEVRRGRPTDATSNALARVVLRLAKQEGWVVEDTRNRTSAALADLLFQLASSAHAAGMTHGRDRRALARALSQALTDDRRELRKGEWLHPHLDALASPAPEMPG